MICEKTAYCRKIIYSITTYCIDIEFMFQSCFSSGTTNMVRYTHTWCISDRASSGNQFHSLMENSQTIVIIFPYYINIYICIYIDA